MEWECEETEIYKFLTTCQAQHHLQRLLDPLRNSYFYFHFTDVEIEKHKVKSNFSNFSTQLVSKKYYVISPGLPDSIVYSIFSIILFFKVR